MPPWTTARASPSPGHPGEGLARQGYALHGAELYRAALARLGDDATAQDAVQETIVRAWRAADRFDPDQGSLRTWLFAILRNVVHDQWAARARGPAPAGPAGEPLSITERASPTEVTSVPDHSDHVADTDLVARALARASEDHRTAIVETYLRGRPYDEVAAELGVNVSTLRSRVFHGLRDLRSTITTMEAER